jgi:methionyl-tRNA formyltransferase
MTHTSKTIVFFGTDEFSAVSLRQLISSGAKIGAVVTKPDSRKGRGRELQPSVVKSIALEHGITVWQPARMVELVEPLTDLRDSQKNGIVGVLVSFGKIIPQSIIDIFDPGIINVHPSLLPLYRGPSPIETAIVNGDSKTGVTIMQLSAQMDAGPIYTQQTHPLTGSETAPELENTLGVLGAEQLLAALPTIMSGELLPVAQNDSKASYCSLLRKEDSLLDPSSITAAQAERRIRAYLAYPKTKVTIAGHSVVLTKAHVSVIGETVLDIQCSDGQYLCIDELIGPSGRAMNAKSFLNGYAAG